MKTWWDSSKPGQIQKVLFIQFDLGGHSAWTAEQLFRDAAKARTEFAIVLRERLSYWGFDPLFWLGDGGVFVRPYGGESEAAEPILQAADDAFEYFSRFQRSISGSEKLSLRATATLIEVVIHQEPSHWYSPMLNEFLKYERDIGRPGAFVITQEVYENLASSRNRFVKPQGAIVGKRAITIYIDSKHPYIVVESKKNFRERLIGQRNSFPSPTLPTSGIRPRDIPVGDTVIVHTALTEAGYNLPQMTLTEFPSTQFKKKMDPFGPKWDDLLEKNKIF